jgi:hypothetical protein
MLPASNYLNMLYIVAASVRMIFAVLNFYFFNYIHFGTIKFQLQPSFTTQSVILSGGEQIKLKQYFVWFQVLYLIYKKIYIRYIIVFNIFEELLLVEKDRRESSHWHQLLFLNALSVLRSVERYSFKLMFDQEPKNSRVLSYSLVCLGAICFLLVLRCAVQYFVYRTEILLILYLSN